MKTATLSAAASGTFKLGQRFTNPSSRLRSDASNRKGHLGRTGKSRGGTPCLASSGRTWHQLYRYGRFLRPGGQRTIDRGGLAPIPSWPGYRNEEWFDQAGSRSVGAGR